MGINYISNISIFVHDQERAKEFYTQKLGMDLRADAQMGPEAEARWIAVAPPASRTEIVLSLPDGNWEHYRQTVGQTQALTLDVSEMDSLVAELKARGVAFASEPDRQPWGRFATIYDSEGNRLLLVEQPQG